MSGTIRTRIVTAYRTPEEALRLNEDAFAIKQAIRLLKSVDRYNVSDDPDNDVFWFCIQKLKMCQRYAENKLKREFLVPPKQKYERG
jgi:hypothetical protein